jgi:hypothetical protein
MADDVVGLLAWGQSVMAGEQPIENGPDLQVGDALFFDGVDIIDFTLAPDTIKKTLVPQYLLTEKELNPSVKYLVYHSAFGGSALREGATNDALFGNWGPTGTYATHRFTTKDLYDDMVAVINGDTLYNLVDNKSLFEQGQTDGEEIAAGNPLFSEANYESDLNNVIDYFRTNINMTDVYISAISDGAYFADIRRSQMSVADNDLQTHIGANISINFHAWGLMIDSVHIGTYGLSWLGNEISEYKNQATSALYSFSPYSESDLDLSKVPELTEDLLNRDLTWTAIDSTGLSLDTGATFNPQESPTRIDDSAYVPGQIRVRVEGTAGLTDGIPAISNLPYIRQADKITTMLSLTPTMLYDSTSITNDAGKCPLWTDLSGNGHNLEASGTARPNAGTRTVNGYDAVEFAGNPQTLEALTFPAFNVNKGMFFMVLADDSVTAGLGKTYFTGRTAGGERLLISDGLDFQFGDVWAPGAIETYQTGVNIISAYRNGDTIGLGYNGTYVEYNRPWSAPTLISFHLGSRGTTNFMTGATPLFAAFDYFDQEKLDLANAQLAHQFDLVSLLNPSNPYINDAERFGVIK